MGMCNPFPPLVRVHEMERKRKETEAEHELMSARACGIYVFGDTFLKKGGGIWNHSYCFPIGWLV